MDILYPLFVMVFWSFTMALFVLFSRISSVRNGAVTMEFYQVFRGGEPPESVLKTTRHWANLFEAPVLFYLLCVIMIALQTQSILLVQLAWGYVIIRCFHSIIHLTYNRVEHRLFLFLVSQGVLIAMWVILLLKVIN